MLGARFLNGESIFSSREQRGHEVALLDVRRREFRRIGRLDIRWLDDDG